MSETRYRIVRDKYLGYEAQAWRWWWPFWWQMGFTNTHPTIEAAEEYIRTGGVVKYVSPTSPGTAAQPLRSEG